MTDIFKMFVANPKDFQKLNPIDLELLKDLLIYIILESDESELETFHINKMKLSLKFLKMISSKNCQFNFETVLKLLIDKATNLMNVRSARSYVISMILKIIEDDPSTNDKYLEDNQTLIRDMHIQIDDFMSNDIKELLKSTREKVINNESFINIASVTNSQVKKLPAETSISSNMLQEALLNFQNKAHNSILKMSKIPDTDISRLQSSHSVFNKVLLRLLRDSNLASIIVGILETEYVTLDIMSKILNTTNCSFTETSRSNKEIIANCCDKTSEIMSLFTLMKYCTFEVNFLDNMMRISVSVMVVGYIYLLGKLDSQIGVEISEETVTETTKFINDFVDTLGCMLDELHLRETRRMFSALKVLIFHQFMDEVRLVANDDSLDVLMKNTQFLTLSSTILDTLASIIVDADNESQLDWKDGQMTTGSVALGHLLALSSSSSKQWLCLLLKADKIPILVYWMKTLNYYCRKIITTFNESGPVTSEALLKNSDSILYVDDDDGPGDEFGLDHLFTDYQDKSRTSVSESAQMMRQESQSKSDDQKQLLQFISDILKTISMMILKEDARVTELIHDLFDQEMIQLVVQTLAVVDHDVVRMKEVFSNENLFGLVGQFINFINLLFSGFINHKQSLDIMLLLSIRVNTDQKEPQSHMDLELGPLQLLVLMNISILFTNTLSGQISPSTSWLTSDKYIKMMWHNMLRSMQHTILGNSERSQDVSQEFLQFFLLIFHGLTSIPAKTEVVASLLNCITVCSVESNCLQPKLLSRLLLTLNYLMHHFYEQAANLAFQLQFNLLTKYLNDSLNREVASYQYEELQILDSEINAIFYDVTVPWSVSRKNWPGSNNDTILLKQILKDPNYDRYFSGVLAAIQLVINQRPMLEGIQTRPLLIFASSFYGVLSNWRLLDILPPLTDYTAIILERGLPTLTELLYDLKLQHSLRRKNVPQHLAKLTQEIKLMNSESDVLLDEYKDASLSDMSTFLTKVATMCTTICDAEDSVDGLAQQLFQVDVLIVLTNFVLQCAKEDLEVKKETEKKSLESKCFLKESDDGNRTSWAVDLLTTLLRLYAAVTKRLESFVAKLNGSSLIQLDLSSLTKTNMELRLESLNLVSLKSLTGSLDKFFDKWSTEDLPGEMSFVNMKRFLANRSFESCCSAEYDDVVEMLRAETHRRFVFIVDQVQATTASSTTVYQGIRLSISTILVIIQDLRDTIGLVDTRLVDTTTIPEHVQASYLDMVVLGSANTFVPGGHLANKLYKSIPEPVYSQVITKKLVSIICELAKSCSFAVSQSHYDVMVKSIDCFTQLFDRTSDVHCMRQIVATLLQAESSDCPSNLSTICSMIFADPTSIPVSIKCCLLKLVNLLLFRLKDGGKDECLASVLAPLHAEIHNITQGPSDKAIRLKVERWLFDILEDSNMTGLESRPHYLSQIILLSQMLAITSGRRDTDSNFSVVIIQSILHMDEKIRNSLAQCLQIFKSGSIGQLPLININVIIEVLCTVSNGCCPMTLYVNVIQTLLDWIKEINRCICCYIEKKLDCNIHMNILCSSLTRIYNHIGAVICALNDQYQTEESSGNKDESCYKEPLASNLYINSFTMNQLAIDKKMVEDILYCSMVSSAHSTEVDIVSESEEDNKDTGVNLLNEQLCTFAATQKEFTEQHWYHCYTCSMIENEGVCTVCAKVCHNQHDLSYAKRGSFFCDCGAKGNPFCEALTRRTNSDNPKKPAPPKMQTLPLDLSKKELLQSKMQLAEKAKYSTLSAMNKLSKYSSAEKPLRKSLKADSKARSNGNKTCDTSSFFEIKTPVVSSKSDPSVTVTSSDDNDRDQLAYRFWITNSMRDKLRTESETLTVLLDTSTLLDDCFSALRTINICFKDLYADWVVGRHKQLKESFTKVRSLEKTSERSRTIIGSSLHLRNAEAPNDLSGIPPISALASDLSGANTQVRNMLQSGYVRRNVIAVVCPNTSNVVSDQYFLAVAQDKARIVVYKVSGLLEELYETTVKREDADVDQEQSLDIESRQGLIEQVCTATLPFTVLSMCANPTNNKYLSVCGLKEVSVLTFTAMGSVSCKTPVTPVLEDSNQFVVRSLWLPGTATFLVLVLTQSVQIFDLATSTGQPVYHFKSVESRFKDATFAFISSKKGVTTGADCSTRDCYVFVMSESGCIHCKKLGKDCLGTGGFYLAEMLDWNPELYSMHRDVKTGVLGKGGASIHYDHCLQLLFHSYNNGHTYCSVLDSGPDEVYVDKNYFLDIKSESEQSATLVDWSSNIDHPGLLMVICQQTNVPVFLSVEPDKYSYQFLEAVDTLATDSSDIPIDAMNKVTDAVTLSWHPSSDCGQRTRRGHFTFSIVLFNDGKIKMLIANHKERHTDGQFWLQDRFTNTFLFNYLLGTANSSSSPKMRNQKSKAREYSRRHFSKDNIFLDDPSCGRVPIDFFEHCEPSKELSFGGDRLLELYSQDVLNARLLSQEHSVTVACKNPVSISIVNKDPDSVIVGIRVGVNMSDLTKVPKYFEIYNRKVALPENLTRNRIVDIGLYKSEILQSEKTLVLIVGPSKNSNDLIVIDSIKVFTRTRSSLPWLADKQAYFSSRDYFAPKKHTISGHSFVEDIHKVVINIEASRHLDHASINVHLPDSGLLSAGLQLITAFYHFKNTLNMEGKPTFSNSELVSSLSVCSFANDLLCAFYPQEVSMNAVALLACVNSMKSLEGDLEPQSNRTSKNLLSGLAHTLFKHGSQVICQIKEQPYDSINVLSIEAHVVRLAHLISQHETWICVDEDKFSSLSYMDVFELMTACVDLITGYHATCSQVHPAIGTQLDMAISPDFVNPVYCQRLDYLPTLIPYMIKAMLTFVFADHADSSTGASTVRLRLTDLIIKLLLTPNLMISHNTRKSLNKFLKTCDRSASARRYSLQCTDGKTFDGRDFLENQLEKMVCAVVDEQEHTDSARHRVHSDRDEQGDPEAAFMEESQQLSLPMQENTVEQVFENDPDEGEVEESDYFCPAEEDWMVAVSNSESNSLGGGNATNDALMFLLESVPGGVMPELMDNFDEQSMIDYAMKKSLEEQGAVAGPNVAAIVDNADTSNIGGEHVTMTVTTTTTTAAAVSSEDTCEEQQSSNNTGAAATVLDTWIIKKQARKTPKVEQLSTPDREYSDSNSGSDLAFEMLKNQDSGLIAGLPQDAFMSIQRFGGYFLRQVCSQWSNLLASLNGERAVALFKSLLDVLKHMDMRDDDVRSLVEELLVLMLDLIVAEDGVVFLDDSESEKRARTEIMCIVLRSLLNLVTAGTTRMISASTKDENNSTTADMRQTTLQPLFSNCVEFLALRLLHEKDLMRLCLSNMEKMVQYWRTRVTDKAKGKAKEGDASSNTLPTILQVDGSHASLTHGWLPDTDHDQALRLLLIEIQLRLPYAVLKLCRAVIKEKKMDAEGARSEFMVDLANVIQKENKWHSVLCEFIELGVSEGVTKASRTLLNSVVGAKHYRTVRDIHLIGGCVNKMKVLLENHHVDINSTRQVRLPFLDTVKLLELVDCCLGKARERPANWKVYCAKCPDILKFLMVHSISLDQTIALKLLYLLQLALLDPDSSKTKKDTPVGPSATQVKTTAEKEKIAKSSAVTGSSITSKQESKLCRVLANRVDMAVLVEFVRVYVCEYDNSGVRWLAEVIVSSLYGHGKAAFRGNLVDILCDLWPTLRLSPQLADLAGHMVAQHSLWQRLDLFTDQLSCALRQAALDLVTHQATPFYSYLQRLVHLPGYYLDNEPCSYCPPCSASNELRLYRWHSEPTDNRRNQARAATITGMGLHTGSSAAGSNGNDYLAPNVRASPTIHVFNLRAPYAMQSLSIKFSSPRRQRPQCAITVYYSDVSTVSTTQMLEQAHLWNKVRTVTISKDMAEVKLDFPVLLTAVYLIFEYDSFSATTSGPDNVKCPRCHSATIQGNVCLNCRDNINQCYHCRAINYAGIDSFICSNCSSCRYARIDFTMNAKPCYDFVEELKSEESRELMINRINIWSETVDKNCQEMLVLKQEFESLLEQVKMTDASEITGTKKSATPAVASTTNNTTAAKLLIGGNRTYADVTGGTSLDDAGLQNRLYRRVRRPAGGETEADKEAAKSPAVVPVVEPTKEESKEPEQAKIVHESLQQIVMKYTNEAKEHQIEMSCLWRQVWAAKKAVAKYDARLTSDEDTILRMSQDASMSHRHSCYKCLLGKVQQLVWLLRGLSSLADSRVAVTDAACAHDLLTVLLGPLLDAVPSWLRQEIIPLIVQITVERSEQIKRLNCTIATELLGSMRLPFISAERETRVKTIITVLRSSVASFDSFWEVRIRPAVAILHEASCNKALSGHCAKFLVAPCVSMMQVCMRYLVTRGKAPVTKKTPVLDADNESSEPGGLVSPLLPVVDIRQWLSSDKALFDVWVQSASGQPHVTRAVVVGAEDVDKEVTLAHKYGQRWILFRNRRRLARQSGISLVSVEDVQVGQAWLWQALLSPTSLSSRHMNHLIIDMLAYQSTERHRLILAVLVQCLPYMVAAIGADCDDLLRLCSRAGPCHVPLVATLKHDLVSHNDATTQYVLLLKTLSKEKHWRCYLVLKCRLIDLLALAITRVLESLSRTEERCLSSWRWSQSVPGLVQGGWAAIHLLKNLTELLLHLQEQPAIGNKHRSTIVRCLLTASLNLRRLVVFRSKTTTDMETRFNKTVDDLSKDTEDIIRSFIKTAVDVLKQFPVTDLQSAGHVIERINAYVCPRDYEHPVFDVVLDIFKGQEDFLPHRMIGVSLNCHSFGRNPTVNDVINFLVRENGVTSDIRLDLICDKKVLMYDLLLEDIYQHVWLKTDASNKNRPMRLTLRISGLVEDNLPYLDNLRQDVPLEHYKRSNELIDGGLHTIMQRLAAVDQLPHGFNVIASSVKLLHYFTHVPGNDALLIDADLNTVRVLLHCLLVCLKGGLDDKRMGEYEEATVVPLIELLCVILVAGRSGPYDQQQLKAQAGDRHIVTTLIDAVEAHSRADLYQKYVTKIPSLLVFDSEDKMTLVLDYVVPHFRTLIPHAVFSDDQRHSLLACCQMVTATPSDDYGVLFRQEMLRRGLLQICVDFLVAAAPPDAMPEDGKLDFKRPETTVFLEQPALQFVLVLGHACVGDKNFPDAGRALLAVPGLVALLHKLETVKSVQTIGVLSEDWLNALEDCDPDVKVVISAARQRTMRNLRAQALKVRQRQLSDMKMTVNEKGQVLTSCVLLKDLSSQLLEEPGHSCAICMDGHVNRPQEALGVYTFVKKVLVHDLMASSRGVSNVAGASIPASVACAGQYYYTSVSNFVCVHFSCHNQAVKVVNENEWLVAQRHNQNAKCNSLLPIMGPNYDGNFKANLNRYQTSIWNNTNVPEINYQLIVHDLKFLLLRFSHGRQFNEDTGGGARLSNMRLIPQVVQIALANLLSQADLVAKETQSFSKWLEQAGGWPKWFVHNMWQATNVPYRVVQSLIFQSPDGWQQNRAALLKLLLQYAHLRHFGVTDLAGMHHVSLEPLPLAVYQPFLVLFGLLQLIYSVYWRDVVASLSSGKTWMEALSLFIREKEVCLLDGSVKMVRQYEDDLLPCDSLQEFWDVSGLAQVQPYEEHYLGTLLKELKDAK